MTKINYMPIPTKCDVCKGSITFVERTQKSVYHGKNRLVAQWMCRDKKCGALVTCHSGTRIPVGYMAQHKVRAMRIQCHKVFDLLWCNTRDQSPFTRETAYRWLARTLDIPFELANISKLSIEQMEKVMEESKKAYDNYQKLMSDSRKANRQGSHDKKKKQAILRNSQRKPKVKINVRECQEFEDV